MHHATSQAEKKKTVELKDICVQDAELIQTGVKTVISYWHDLALLMHQRDYSKRDLGRADESPTQPGPAYSSRALTIVHLAMYDALAGITGEGDTYLTYSFPAPEVSGM